MAELNQVPGLFLVDPSCALVQCYHEIAESLRSLFGCNARTIKHYLRSDANQLSAQKIAEIVAQAKDQIYGPNADGMVVRDFTHFDFVRRAAASAHNLDNEEVFENVRRKNEIVYGSLLNNTQFFAEIGGFNALIALFKMGMEPGAGEESKQDAASAEAKESYKLPFGIMHSLTKAFTHLNT